MEHYRKLERMYLSAPINVLHNPTINIQEKEATISQAVSQQFFHSGNYIHGSVYFKLLDDSAFFAVQSIITDRFVYTISFECKILIPINTGIMKAHAALIENKKDKIFIASSKVFDEHDNLLGKGQGKFMKSPMLLSPTVKYY